MKKVLSLVVALAMCMSTFSIAKADELTDAQKDYKEVQNSINDKKQEVKEIDQKQASAQKVVEELDQKMNTTAKKLSEIKNNIASVNEEIAAQEKQIKETLKDIEEGNELFKKRVRAMYINGNESYLDILFSSSSFSDFISKIDVVSKLIEYDKNIITGMEQKSEELKNTKTSLEKKKVSMVALKESANKEYKALEADSDKKREYMSQLQNNKEEYLKLIDQEESESKAIQAMIKKIKEKKAAEEARRKAEANRGGTGSVISTDSKLGKLYCVTGVPYRITSPFGMRFHPILKKNIGHAGMDIGVSSGTSVYALTDGEVIYSGTMSGYGNVVMIDHGSITSLYAHNSSLQVRVGQEVKGGQLIAYSGNTGRSTGPHLHFEIRNNNGVAIDPSSYYVR